MLDLGGVHSHLLGHRAVRLLPVTDLDAGTMWRSLPGALLTDYRDEPRVDTAALEDLLIRIGRLAEDLPEVAKLELEPLLALPHDLVAVDARLCLISVGSEPDPTLRALPEPAC
jgi:ATP-grasp domain